jgi:hypothetical protein
MDLYVARGLDRGLQLLPNNDPDVIALSHLLQKLPVQGVRLATYRNPVGVARKLGNFRSVQLPGTGSPNHAGMDARVWAEFKDDLPRLRRVAREIRATI